MMATLTSAQLAVANHDGSHAIVGAAPGSGKTHTMVARIVRLLLAGVDPSRILVLMFNSSAQADFERRLGLACAAHGLQPAKVQTFHSFGLRIASRMAASGLLPDLRFEPDLGVQRKLAREVLREVNASLAEGEALDLTYEVVGEFLEAIDILKGELFPAADGRGDPAARAVDQRFVEGFRLFEAARVAAGLRFFSDLIYEPVLGALSDPRLAKFIADRYQHLIVDEFQDINECQMTLVRLLAGSRAKVMAVGDEDQTVYRWRGAKPDYMLSLFEKEFPGATRYALPHTFRYGHALALMANFVITNNTQRTDKICLAGSDRQTVVDVRVPALPGDEVVACLRDWQARGRRLDEAAILIREYAHSVASEIALLQAGIPYRIVGAAPFFERSEALGLRAYLQLAAGGFGGVEDRGRRVQLVTALLQTPTLYLSKATVESIAEEAADAPAEFLRIAERTFLADRRALPFTTTRRLEAVDRWRWVLGIGPSRTAHALLVELIGKLNLYKEIEKSVPDRRVSAEKIRIVGQLLKLAQERPQSPAGFAEFLDQLALEYGTSSSSDDRVLLTSCHRAKGLEWPLVILPELSDGQFPSLREGSDETELEDERRLFYVAITRAMECLVLIAPQDRLFILAAHGGVSRAPAGASASRFVYEGNPMVAAEGLARARKVLPDQRCEAVLARYLATA